MFMYRKKVVITSESLNKNSTLIGMKGLKDGVEDLDQMQFCERLSPLKKESNLEEAGDYELMDLCFFISFSLENYLLIMDFRLYTTNATLS